MHDNVRMKLLWDRFELATGRLAQANKVITDLAHELVENYGWPKKVTVGNYWLKELKDRKIKSYYIGAFGINAEVEIVPGAILKVE